MTRPAPSDAEISGLQQLRVPKMALHGAVMGPSAPAQLADTGVEGTVLQDLALKFAYSAPHLTTEWTTRRLRLPLPIVQEVLEQLRADRLVEPLGQLGPFNLRYTITQRGRERVGHLMEICGYVGPAPVSLEAYTALLEWQIAHSPRVLAADVQSALADLVLTPEALQLAGLAISSGRSLFVFGPPGNGKTSLGRLLHAALRGELWIPYCLSVENDIIRFYDPQCHRLVETGAEQPAPFDQRWLRIRRPLVVVGGEVTLDSFDLIYSRSQRYYEAPLHFKANGGTFLMDDFGRERIEWDQLLNRWITPLEHQLDYLTIRAGQKIQVPLRQAVIIATNLNPDHVTDPAFIRRMGYRLYLGPPNPEQYTQIFERYGQRLGLSITPDIVQRLLERYQAESRELRCCEPRDLLERAGDICRFREQPLSLNEEILDLAWTGYFGNKASRFSSGT
jgi:hypothetical protein